MTMVKISDTWTMINIVLAFYFLDYGVNDAGSLIFQRVARQNKFLDFIGVDKKSPLRKQDGIFHYIDIFVDMLKIRFLFLDTRSHRDSHWIRSVGEFDFPFAAMLAAGLRLLYVSMGFGSRHDGDILGNEQLKWLEDSLHSSDADAHVLISSIQILTTNPVVESWGHFPIAKRNFLNLLGKLDPKNLIFLSGDVHYGEISYLPYRRLDGQIYKWIEVTSSGLTHTCGDTILTRYLCPLMIKTFARHRHYPGSYFIGRNFGVLKISSGWESPIEEIAIPEPEPVRHLQPFIEVAILDSSSGNVMLSYQLNISTSNSLESNPVIAMYPHEFSSSCPGSCVVMLLLSLLVIFFGRRLVSSYS